MDRRDLLPPGPGGELTPAEQRLVACAASGEWWFPRGECSPEQYEDPADAGNWTEAYRLRADVIYCLLTGTPWTDGATPWALHPHGLGIVNAEIDGMLDFRGGELMAPLEMKACAIPKTIVLIDAKARTFVLDGSKITAIKGWRAEINGDLSLREVVQFGGEVNFCGVSVTGQFVCSGAKFENAGGSCLICIAMNVHAGVFLDDGFSAVGEVNLSRATIEGRLSCSGGRFENAGKNALYANSLMAGDVLLVNGFHAIGEVQFRHAQVNGLACDGGVFENRDGEALNCDGITVTTCVFLRSGYRASGGVSLGGAKIGSQLDCSGGYIENAGGRALFCHGAKIDAGVLLNDGFRAVGEVNFEGARVGSYFLCTDGGFENEGGAALSCKTISVESDVHLNGGFTAIGSTVLNGAKVGGQLCCDGGRFIHKAGFALDCGGVSVASNVRLWDGFYAVGEVFFFGASVGGSFSCTDGQFENPGKVALRLGTANIAGGLYFIKVAAINGKLDLEQTQIKTLHDDGSAWPRQDVEEPGSIWLDGFTYQRFSHTKDDWKTRLAWLNCQRKDHLGKDFKPQPWTQLINVLREMGHEEDARMIAIERARAMARRPQVGWLERLWQGFLGITVGYGYRPGLALRWSAAFLFVGFLTFYCADRDHYMAPRDGSVIAYMAEHNAEPPGDYTKLHPLVYALDVYLPVIELGQDVAWAPSFPPAAQDRETDAAERLGDDCWPPKIGACAAAIGKVAARVPQTGMAVFFDLGLHRFVYWLEQIFGWVFVSLYVAGMSGVMKKE